MNLWSVSQSDSARTEWTARARTRTHASCISDACGGMPPSLAMANAAAAAASGTTPPKAEGRDGRTKEGRPVFISRFRSVRCSPEEGDGAWMWPSSNSFGQGSVCPFQFPQYIVVHFHCNRLHRVLDFICGNIAGPIRQRVPLLLSFFANQLWGNNAARCH